MKRACSKTGEGFFLQPSPSANEKDVSPTRRIMAMHNGTYSPLFDDIMHGPVSPSPSLRIEWHRIEPLVWPRVLIPKQVVTLALDTHEVQLEQESMYLETLVRQEGTVTVQQRDLEQRICWKSTATTLTVELDDTVLDEVHATDAEFGVGQNCVQELSPLLYALEAERRRGYPHGRIFVDGLEQAIASVVTSLGDCSRGRRPSKTPTMAPYQMRLVQEFVRAHLDQKIVLSDLAREAGLSVSHLSRLFRNSFGKTPHQYVLEQRIDHSKSMMNDARYSLLDIAIASGFRTHQHFSKVFHRISGCPPRQFRSQI